MNYDLSLISEKTLNKKMLVKTGLSKCVERQSDFGNRTTTLEKRLNILKITDKRIDNGRAFD